MKFNKKLKWSFGLIGLTAMAVVPMSVALVSCGGNGDSSSNKGNNISVVVDSNGIIQPLTKSNITPTQYNFDNRLTNDTAEIINVNSLEEANQILNDRWSALSNDQKLECIKNDIQNWFNQGWYNVNFHSYSDYVLPNRNQVDYFLPNSGTIDNYLLVSRPADWGGPNTYNDPNRRVISWCNINNINIKNNLFNLNYNLSYVDQEKVQNSPMLVAQFEYVYNYIYENIIINPIVLNVNNKYISGLVFSTNSHSIMNIKMESGQKYNINESIEGFTSSDIAEAKNMIGKTFYSDRLENNRYYNIISPYLNIKFNITNSK